MQLSRDVYKLLKERHPTLYKEMGSPTYMKSELTNNNGPLLSYLYKNKWEGLEDEELTSVSKNLKVVFSVQLVAGLILVVYVVYELFIVEML